MSIVRLLVFLTLAIAVDAGCKQDKPLDYKAPLPPGTVALRKIPPEMYPDFAMQQSDVINLRPAIQHSLEYLDKPSSKLFYPYIDITHERAVATLKKLLELTDPAAGPGAWDAKEFNQKIRDNFDVYQSVGAPTTDGTGYTGKVLFTGYFTPIYDASLTQQGPYQWPVYKKPADLEADPVTGDTKGRRTPDGQLVPYYTRAEIEQQGKLAGQEFVWLKSRWEAYVVTIQGSARLHLTDGRTYEIGYAGNNGYDYTSPGQQMLADGAITQDQYSLKGIGAYFQTHPQDMDKYLLINQRTVFFTERPGGPFGSLNVPVTPMASIATDKQRQDIYPRAMPAFLTVPVPNTTGGTRDYHGFMMDQDTGGAIRAAGRCDIFMGIGEEAEQLAGHQLAEGNLYYIAIKPDLMQK
jgi:membrane-bound lytic murein transglycosylase A